MAKWTHAIQMRFEIELVNGTRIGGGGAGLDIGGVDLLPIKDPVSGQPYLPGSSLKGKLRSILETQHGLSPNGSPCSCGLRDCPVCPVFGAHIVQGKPPRGSARLTVRDAYFTSGYAKQYEDKPILETKMENIVDRIRVASTPRSQERVPAGAKFGAEMVLKVFEGDDDEKMVKDLNNALAILQGIDSLGAGGSRGSGRIKINNFVKQKIALADLTL